MLTVPSFNKKGKYYVIDDNGNCSCPGFYFRRTCKHVEIAKELKLLPVIAQLNPLPLPTLNVEPMPLCLVCSQPLTSVIEVPSQKHGRCMLKWDSL